MYITHDLHKKGNNEDYSGASGFNFAKSNAVSSDLKNQADQLISKLKRSPDIETDKDWKVFVNPRLLHQIRH